MKKSLIISEADNIAALVENDRIVEFFVNRGELLLGDIYVAIVENILPGIDAAFVNLGKDKMGFLHANDIPGEGTLKERLVPKQKLLVQITKEPTGHKGPRVSTAISLPGRFLVLVPEERGISISRRISESKERARLKSVVTLMKPPGVGVIIRTEAKGQSEESLFEDFEQLFDCWQTTVSEGEASIGPQLVYRDQDLLYRVIRDAYSVDVSEIIVDTEAGQKRALEFMAGWAGRGTKVLHHTGEEPLLVAKGIDKEIESVLSDRAELPSGGHLNIQPTEALTVIDVNSGRFTSSRTQAETVRRTNVEAASEIPRQLRLRNIGGMVIVDFIDMDNKRDQQQVLEVFNRCLEDDRAKPQVGQMSDLGLVELTRRRQGQSLRELFATRCPHCAGTGVTSTLAIGSKEPKRINNTYPQEIRANVMSNNASFAGTQQRVSLANHGSGLENNDITSVDVADDTANARGYSKATGTDHFRGRTNNVANGTIKADDSHSSVPDNILDQVPEELLGFQDEPQTSNKEFLEASEINNDSIDSYRQEDSSDNLSADINTEQADLYITASKTNTVLPKSNFETELDPVTGIYQLKSRLQRKETASIDNMDQNSIREIGYQLELPLENNYLKQNHTLVQDNKQTLPDDQSSEETQ